MAQVKFLPSGKTATVNIGTTLLAAAQAVGLTKLDCCALRPICGACKMSVICGQDALNSMGKTERQYCSAHGYLPYQRIGCMAKITKDVELWVELE